MFRQISTLALLVAVGGFTAGCTTKEDGSKTVDIDKVQSIAVGICAFLPTAQTITKIWMTATPGLTTAEAIGAAICNSITTAKAAPGVRPMVAGVVIEGRPTR